MFFLKDEFYRYLTSRLRQGWWTWVLRKKLLAKTPTASIDLDVKIVGVQNICLGQDVRIDKGCYLNAGGKEYIGTDGRIVLGDHVIVGFHSILFAGGGRIEIGDLTRIGLGCIISAQSEDSFANPDTKPAEHKHIFELVQIGKSCLIAGGAIILGGSDIGDHSIIGAGAVVKGKYPPNSTLIGNPARAIPRLTFDK
ncbi:MAG: acyltransferase [Flavobacteriaceae bacterium]|nr:acyltransferase [Flavobacteriaceae bacterium]